MLLRLILLQYAMCFVASFFLLTPLTLWLWEAAMSARMPEPLTCPTLALTPAAYVFVVWSWLHCYQAKRWALTVLGALSMGSGISCAALIVYGLPTVVGLGLATLLTAEGLYLLKLSEWVRAHPPAGGSMRHGRPCHHGGASAKCLAGRQSAMDL
jgi:hypothetical protein